MTTVPENRTLRFESIANARELGGLVMEDGRRVKHGLLLRCGDLHAASDKDLTILQHEFNVRQIFDFRTEVEVKIAPDKEVCGAKNIWLPTIDPQTEKYGYALPQDAYRNIGVYILSHSGEERVQEVARRIYSDMVLNEYSQLQYASFLNIIANQTEGSVLWHCSQGKDRTGLGAAFLLAALGASRETIMEDFALSNIYYSNLVENISERILSKGGGQQDLAVVQAFIGVNTNYFNAALDLISEKYGSLHQYTREALLLSPKDSMKLRKRYLE